MVEVVRDVVTIIALVSAGIFVPACLFGAAYIILKFVWRGGN